jgi:hypothetical protein
MVDMGSNSGSAFTGIKSYPSPVMPPLLGTTGEEV